MRIRPSTSFDRDKDVAVLSTGMNTLICASDHATSMGCNAVPEGQYVYDAVFGPEHTNKQVGGWLGGWVAGWLGVSGGFCRVI